jgi:hypothetical protein
MTMMKFTHHRVGVSSDHRRKKNLLIDFVHGAHRLQYYDGAGLCSAGRGPRELSTALKICWTLSAPSNRINGKFRTANTAVPCPYSGRTIVPKAMLYATQMRAGD